MESVFCFRRRFKGKVMEVQHRGGCARPRSHLLAPRAELPELPTAWAAAPRPGKRRSPAPSPLLLLSHQQRGPRHYPPRHLQPSPHRRAAAEPGKQRRSRARSAPQEAKGPARPRHARCRPAAPALERKQSGRAGPGPRGAAAHPPGSGPASQAPPPPPLRNPRHRAHRPPSPPASAAE